MKKLRCSRCRGVKLLTEFSLRAGTRRGRRSECRSCKQRMNERYYAANRMQVLARLTRRRKTG